MAHNFSQFPELTNSQMEVYYFMSPHKQITEDFRARVVKVIDGDTVRLRWKERNFDFPLRLSNIAAPESDEKGGKESQNWLEKQLLGEDVDVIVNPKNRVEKWGRLLGNVIIGGFDIGEASVIAGKSVLWADRKENSPIPNFNKEMVILGKSF